MISFEEDSIIIEVRKNRTELLAEFGGDTKKLVEHFIAQSSAMEAAGWKYETETELETRKALHRQQQEIELRKIDSLLPESLQPMA